MLRKHLSYIQSKPKELEFSINKPTLTIKARWLKIK